jgi:hypothetical protein
MTTTMTTTNNYFYSLPVELQRLIYDFDPTYHLEHQEVLSTVKEVAHLMTNRKFVAVSDSINGFKYRDVLELHSHLRCYAPRSLQDDNSEVIDDSTDQWLDTIDPELLFYIDPDFYYSFTLHKWSFRNVLDLMRGFYGVIYDESKALSMFKHMRLEFEGQIDVNADYDEAEEIYQRYYL